MHPSNEPSIQSQWTAEVALDSSKKDYNIVEQLTKQTKTIKLLVRHVVDEMSSFSLTLVSFLDTADDRISYFILM